MRAGMASEKASRVDGREDAPCLAAALMAQRPPARPREDALLKAERSCQRARIELLNKQLLGEEAKVENVDLEEIMSKVRPRAPSGQSLPCPVLRQMRCVGRGPRSRGPPQPRHDPT